MKKLARQALAFQYQLQIENAQAVLNNNNAALILWSIKHYTKS